MYGKFLKEFPLLCVEISTFPPKKHDSVVPDARAVLGVEWVCLGRRVSGLINESPIFASAFEATFVVTWRSWHWKVATAAGTNERVELRHGENRLWDPPGSVTKKSPLLKSDRIPFKGSRRKSSKYHFLGAMFVKLQGCMPFNGCCCCDSLYVLLWNMYLYLWRFVSLSIDLWDSSWAWGIAVVLLEQMYRQGLTGNLYPHLLSFPLSNLAIFVGQMPMPITNNSWRWLMTSNPTLQGLPSKPWTSPQAIRRVKEPFDHASSRNPTHLSRSREVANLDTKKTC